MITRYSILDTQKNVTPDSVLVARTTNDERRSPWRSLVSARRATRKGVTLIELVMALSIASIVMLVAAMLISSGFRGWNQIYNNANSESRLGAMDTMVALGAIGRKSNRMDYRVYEVTGSVFEKVGVDPPSSPDDILTGQAIEFRYWDAELSAGLMSPDVNATAYALFYLDTATNQLKVDRGPYPPGGVTGSLRNQGAGVATTTLAENVVSVEFSHTAKNITGDGYGCVRMKLVINDTTDETEKTTLAATLMRNTWPQ